MIVKRVIPVLLLSEGLVVKTQQFKRPTYIGDPVNAVKIFNQKEVDELVLLDMDPCRRGAQINYAAIEEIASEAFMPLAYGGGVRDVESARRIVSSGIEKVVVNSVLADDISFLHQLSAELGSQAVIASIDYRSKRFRGSKTVVSNGGRRELGVAPVDHALACEQAGAGEILLNCVDQDGMMNGMDVPTISSVSAALSIPVVACGGAGSVEHLQESFMAGASAVAASSLFVFHGPHKAVLITYPSRSEMLEIMERGNIRGSSS